ncbi:hypothetical protein MHYP_G00175830 [Metynnis hypsauchen]
MAQNRTATDRIQLHVRPKPLQKEKRERSEKKGWHFNRGCLGVNMSHHAGPLCACVCMFLSKPGASLPH